MSGISGKYRLEARLGGGGMAEVFIASTVGVEGFSRRVAIKRVLPGLSDHPAFAKMFIDEAKISSRLAHPNIVSVLDFDRDADNRLYLVMELVDGKDLEALAATGPLPVAVIIYVIGEVLRGLGHAHDLPVVDAAAIADSPTLRTMRGLVHRDVSPHNVLLSWEGAVKVSDFGIAKARSASAATASVLIKGKPAYMSPEQANGQPLDGRSDLFAVGVMLWELLVGRRLFVGEDTRATLAGVLFGQIARPRSLRGDVPKDIERVTMKLLERDPPARYPTAEAAVSDLMACADAAQAGREQLVRVLAERFSHQAPVRHSQRSQRGAMPGPASAGDVPSHERVTIAAGPPRPPAPSLGALRDTPTATIEPRAALPPAARGGRVVIAAVGALAALLVTFAIIAAVGKPPRAIAPPSDSKGQGTVECIGRSSAKHHLVYLHGMDTPMPSAQEREMRRRLTQISDELDLRIALPRAEKPCPTQTGLRCWGWRFDRAELQPVLASIDRAVATCFSEASEYGLLGFSNGGVAINKLVQLCVPHAARWHLSVASAGNWNPTDPADLHTCGKLRMLVGTSDGPNAGPAQEYAGHLRALGGDVTLTSFDGGHEVPYQETKSVMGQLLATATP